VSRYPLEEELGYLVLVAGAGSAFGGAWSMLRQRDPAYGLSVGFVTGFWVALWIIVWTRVSSRLRVLLLWIAGFCWRWA